MHSILAKVLRNLRARWSAPEREAVERLARTWPLWRIALIWIAWPVSLVLLAMLTAIVIVWRAEHRAVRAGAVLPPQFSDFSIRLDLFPSILVWFGPPLLATIVWLWQRSRARTRGA